jgi:hypothetical protein
VNLSTKKWDAPPFQIHHAMMGVQQEMIERLIPVPVLLYTQYLKIVHSGKRIGEIMQLPDAEFGQFTGEGWHMTSDAGLFPYEGDKLPGLSVSFSGGLSLTATGTEDLVRIVFRLCVKFPVHSNM